VLVWAVAFAGGGTPPGKSCEACHQEIVATFRETAHFRTSADATARSVRGHFAAGRNVLRTGSPGISFRMERRDHAFYQTAVDSARGWSRTERIDLVFGSGRRGQTYVYWRGGLLFELPVSYLVGIERWINSPGYADGQIDFGRLIVPRCLECHTTSFPLRTAGGAARYSRDYVLGISCEKCHGDGRAHVRYQASHPAETSGRFILNPARFSRDRRVDNCALCHAGERDAKAPPFSYRPGDNLDDYFAPPADQTAAIPDVHGNQVALLQRSKCFRSSPDMSCSTCHDVHGPQRDVAAFVQKCLACHETSQHPLAAEIGGRLVTACIQCHMPNRKSKAIEINSPTKPFALYFRSHAIGIYPEVTRAVLQSNSEERSR
jgi:hypothetical protein